MYDSDTFIGKNSASNQMKQVCMCRTLLVLFLTTLLIDICQPAQPNFMTACLCHLSSSPSAINAQNIDNKRSGLFIFQRLDLTKLPHNT